ncbi:MAG: Holliday junction branch migration protein RuvA [Coriobacteriia bacterium]|nr:Holliday junction branch migration protein RuvA [Coriobacteriia bacterium]
MIAYLRGRIVKRDATCATLEVGGIGYSLTMSTQALAGLGEVGAEATVYTLLQIRDDAPVLFGFSDLEEKSLFEKLITISSIGPKVALSALSSFAPADLALCISDGDVARLASVPGIGKKTAQRIVLELKGSLELEAANEAADKKGSPASERNEANEALLNMGFTTSEIQAALKGFDASKEGNASAAALVRYALKRLGGR